MDPMTLVCVLQCVSGVPVHLKQEELTIWNPPEDTGPQLPSASMAIGQEVAVQQYLVGTTLAPCD